MVAAMTARKFVLPEGDSFELLESAAMSGGKRVRARIVFKRAGFYVVPHIHLCQDETFEVLTGELTYLLDGKKHVASAGTTVVLPRGKAHRHFCETGEEVVLIQTIEPGLDFDRFEESIFGLAEEGKLTPVLRLFVQSLVWARRMKSVTVGADAPVWLQRALAVVIAPMAELFGYRAVYQRFSGEEW